jgi:hypothetical protein
LLEHAATLPDVSSADVNGLQDRRCDRESPSIGRWVLRQGVWLWT